MGGPYIIKGEVDLPAVGAFRRQTAADAITKAVELMNQGIQNVTIMDVQGNVYGPADFPRLLASEEE